MGRKGKVNGIFAHPVGYDLWGYYHRLMLLDDKDKTLVRQVGSTIKRFCIVWICLHVQLIV